MELWPKFVVSAFFLSTLFLWGDANARFTHRFPSNCDPSLLKVGASFEELKAKALGGFQFPSDNEAFKKRFPSLKPSDDVLFFHVENAVLKTLNDKIVSDKQLSAAFLNLYKRVLWENVQKDAVLKEALIPVEEGGSYSDFKTVRLAFNSKNEFVQHRVQNALQRVFQKAAIDFRKEVEGSEAFISLNLPPHGLLASPSAWHLAGMGRSPEQAALVARHARFSALVSPDKIDLSVSRFDSSIESQLAKDVREIRAIQLELLRQLNSKKNFERLMGKDGVLTLEAIEEIRKIDTDLSIVSPKDFAKAIQSVLRTGYGVEISEAGAHLLRAYFHKLNRNMPSLFISSEESIGLADIENATHGAISFDLRGMGSKNIKAAMEVFSKVARWREQYPQSLDSEVAENVLVNLRKKQDEASDIFVQERNRISEELKKQGVLFDSKRVSKSGDDVTWLPERKLEDADIARAIKRVQSSLSLPLRTTVQPQVIKDTAIALKPSERFEWITRTEHLEKSIRKFLEREIPEWFLEGTLSRFQFTLAISPKSSDFAGVEIWVDRMDNQKVSPTQLSRLRTAIQAYTSKVQRPSGDAHLVIENVELLDEVIQGK